MSENIGNIKKFAEFLAQHERIDGEMERGKVKDTFGRLGQSALKELAAFLGVKEYKVSFNRAGTGMSGDLTLMGMFEPGKGIYISLNKDRKGDILYRSIKDMKDFSGGMNNWMKETDLEDPEHVKEKILKLLSVSPKSEKKDEAKSLEPYKSRQPQEMTKEEFIRYVVNYADIFGNYPKQITDNLKIVSEYESPLGGMNEFSITKPTKEKARKYAEIVHAALVRRESEDPEGYVSGYVLKDYPELVAENKNKILSAEEAKRKCSLALKAVLLSRMLLDIGESPNKGFSISNAELKTLKDRFTYAEADFYGWNGKQKLFKDASGKMHSRKEIEFEELEGTYEQGGKLNKGVYQVGFDGTDFKTVENFNDLLETCGLSPHYMTGHYTDNPEGFPTYLWQGDGIRMITANNPLLKNGYASFIGIEGQKKKVIAAAAYIEKFTESSGTFGLEYIDFGGQTFEDEKSKPTEQTDIKKTDAQDYNLLPEEYRKQFNEDFEAAIKADNKFEAAQIINILYRWIVQGRYMELTPLLIEKAQTPKLKTALNYTYDGLRDIYDQLIENKDFKKHLNTNLWNLLPEDYKNLKKIKPLAWEADPENDGLKKLLKNFLIRDTLRPVMMTANFEKDGVVATDAEKLIFLNKSWKGKKGLYCLSDQCFQNFSGQKNPIQSDRKFPNYENIIPRSFVNTLTLDAEALRQYCIVLRESDCVPERTNTACFKYAENAYIFFDVRKLEHCMEAFLRMDYAQIDMGINTPNKGVLISPFGMTELAHQHECPFILLMPMYGEPHPGDEGFVKGDFYYDLMQQAVITVGQEPVFLSEKPSPAKQKNPTEGSEKMEGPEMHKDLFIENNYIGHNDITDSEYPWDMTQSDYQKIKSLERTGYPHMLEAADKKKHEELVKKAFSYGIQIPEEVLKDYPEMKTENKNPLTGDTWFKEHPEKILGEPYETTNRFNRPVTRVKGSMENVVKGIDVPEIKTQHVSPVTTEQAVEESEHEEKEPLEDLLKNPSKRKNIERVIQETKKQHADKALRKLNGEKEKYAEGCPEEYLCFDEIMRIYNPEISEDEVKVWIWYKRKTHGFNDEKVILNKKNGWSKYVVPLTEIDEHIENWRKKGIIAFYKGSFIPSILYYAENIYDRQSALLADKSAIVKDFGQEQYDRQWEGLEKVKPSRLTLTDPSVDNRLFIKPDSTFAKEVRIRKLADGTVFREYKKEIRQYVDGDSSLVDAFKTWIQALPKDEFKRSTDFDIVNYYLLGGNPSRRFDKEEKLRLKQNAKMEGDKFFVRFLAEAVSREDQLRIEQLWNSKYNGYVEINYFKVPVAFTCSSTFKNKPLFIRPAQREGIGFISVHGSGCIAYDVGLGKTMTAILSLAQALEYGQCKRPFIVVPNQTYKNWLSELRGVVEKGKVMLSGLLPQYQVMDLYNLGTDYIDQLRDENGHIKPVPENTISVLTYEGFNRLGFNNETWIEIGDQLYAILNQGMEKDREQQQLHEKIEELMGKGIKGGMVNVEDLGFDYMVVDEAHAMKKSFTQVKGEVQGEDDSREKSSYKIQSGEPSMTALRGFMISQYILRRNKMRNVQLLTATPFTNSPLEIYSMLALIGYQALEKSGIKNIKEFFDTFIKTSLELVINAKMKPQRKEIVMGFHNLISLQKLIFKFIIYKTGEDANIQRPHKIVLPLLNEKVDGKVVPLPTDKQISTNLPMTAEQKSFMSDVELYVRGITDLSNFCVNSHGEEEGEEEGGGELLVEANMSDEEKEGTRILRGLSFARQLALSPFLYACNAKKHPTHKEYIETSPKLSYVMECIKSVKRFHEDRGEEVSGQVIYMNAGVHFFPLIKEYLIREVGYLESEVGIIKSGMSAAKKEGIKERFLAGSVKIIIGSATIKEGINLQNRATVLYNCWLDWNPTDVKQLEGRIWRFGNMWANVRVVNPLIENSIDVFIFQKVEEKTSRINEIWYRAGKTNALSLEEFNPAELKMGLVTDPNALAELILMEEREKTQDEITSLRNQLDVLTALAEQRDIFNKNIDKVKKTVENYRPAEEGKSRNTDTILRIFKDYLDDPDSGHNYSDEVIFDKVRKANSAIKRGIEQILAPRGLDISFDEKKLTSQLNKEIDTLTKQKDDRTGDKAIKAKAEEIIQDRIKKGYKPKSVNERVKEFTNLNPKCLTELMVYDNSEEAQVKQLQQEKRGKALEESSDNIDEMEKLMNAMEEMRSLLKEMEQLQAA